uniref:Cytochrome c oxidase subunit 5B, mitochondrial-like n=2 Tax=Sinocyclocheilus grahami TaxID=75366 RepID=A0A672SS02_SINGR
MASKVLLRACRLTLKGRQHIIMKTAQRAMAGKGIPTDEEQAAGLERRVLQAMKKGQDPYSIFKPKEYTGTRDDPHIVPSINNKRLVGCLCKIHTRAHTHSHTCTHAHSRTLSLSHTHT